MFSDIHILSFLYISFVSFKERQAVHLLGQNSRQVGYMRYRLLDDEYIYIYSI